jgi:hypothetical protein
MVTAPAPAFSDSHALSPANAGAAQTSSHSSPSFQSVYQSLPSQAGSSEGDSGPQLPNSKQPGSKKGSPKASDDNLPAVATVAVATDPAPQRPSLSFGRAAAPGSAGQFSAASVAETEVDASQLPGLRAGSNTGLASSRQLAPGRDPAFNPQGSIPTPPESLAAPAPETEVPDSRRSPENPSRGSAAGPSSQRSVDPALFSKGLAASLAPKNENLAFSLRLLDSTSAARRTPVAPQPGTARTQPATLTKNDERPPASPAAATATRAPAPANLPGEFAAATATANPVWADASAPAHPDLRTDIQISEPREAANPSAVAALHEAQPVLPETPKPNATGEILLQLGGKDQAAAIRVSDRAGTVNVSVHAADPDLRSSLRSNLGELASQLTHQGWKTDVVKTGTVLTRGETSQDSRQDGQRSSGQQQPSAQGERQPQRDRRANSGQWLAELEEQASGKPGGTN